MKKQILFFVNFLSFCCVTNLWAGEVEDRLLIDAIRHNAPMAVQEAVEAGADVNLRVLNGNTPLHLAAINPINEDTIRLITLLVINGARVNVRNTAGQFPVDLARGKPGFEEIQELLGSDSCPICFRPINPDDAFRRGNIIFGCSPKHIIHEACLLNPLTHRPLAACPTCRATLDEAAAREERNALMAHYTATEEHLDIIPVLPDVIANPWVFLDAAERGNLAQVQAQLDANVNINVNVHVQHDFNGQNDLTALMFAARSGHSEIVNALLAHAGIDVNAQTHGGITALMFAAKNGHVEIVNALLEHADIDVNAHAFYYGSNDYTALIFAADNGHLEIVNALLSHAGIDVNVQTHFHDQDSYTALMFAAHRGHLGIVNALLAHVGIDVNAHGPNTFTALMFATNSGRLEIVNALLAHPDIDVNAHDDENKTAIDYATPDSEIEHVLIAHGAHRHEHRCCCIQ